MFESGGPTTQGGIFYQNSVAALYLGRLIDFQERNSRDTIIRVQVEALSSVDDIIVTFSDQHKSYVHVKASFSESGKTWANFWDDIFTQSQQCNSGDEFKLIFGSYSDVHSEIRDICRRAETSESYAELQQRLTEKQRKRITKIYSLFSGTEV